MKCELISQTVSQSPSTLLAVRAVRPVSGVRKTVGPPVNHMSPECITDYPEYTGLVVIPLYTWDPFRENSNISNIHLSTVRLKSSEKTICAALTNQESYFKMTPQVYH